LKESHSGGNSRRKDQEGKNVVEEGGDGIVVGVVAVDGKNEVKAQKELPEGKNVACVQLE